jgi:hypothetical protein
MRFSHILAGLMVVCSAAGAAGRSSVYRNNDYGIYLPIPKGAWLCPASGYGIDHGPALLLGSTEANVCRSSSEKRMITIFASPITEDDKTLHSFLNSLCSYAPLDEHDPSLVCVPAPDGLSVNGLPSEAARVNLLNGWVEIIVVTHAGKPDPNFDASVPSMDYDLRLYSNASHFDDDLMVFRTMLNTIKIGGWPPFEVPQK